MRERSERSGTRVRVFLGDPALTEDRANAAIANFVAPDRRDLDFEIVRLPEDSIDRVSEALCQVGMFAQGRCVLLKGPLEDPKPNDEKEESDTAAYRLWKFLETRLPPDAALVIVTPKIDGRSNLSRWLKANAEIEDLRIERKSDTRPADPSSLADAVEARVRANGFPPPSPAVVDGILVRAGTNVGELWSEIDRLCLTIGVPRALTARDVTEHVRDAAGAWIFDFVDAICERRAGPALTLVAELIAAGDAPLRIVATLATRVADFLVAARYAATAKLPPPPSSAGAFAKNVYPSLPEAVRRRFTNPYRTYHVFRVGQARGYRSLRRLHRLLVDLDLSLKSGGGQPRHLLAEFVASACEPGA
jgi:DNA polymerase III delta subunit